MNEAYQDLNTKEFRERLLLNIYGVEELSEVKEYVLTEEDWEKIDEFAAEYTANWEWNYGKSPDFDLERSERIEGVGTVEVKLNVEKGIISAIKLYGDFFGMGEIEDVEKELLGTKYDAKSIQEKLETIDLHKYIGNVSAAEVTEIIY